MFWQVLNFGNKGPNFFNKTFLLIKTLGTKDNATSSNIAKDFRSFLVSTMNQWFPDHLNTRMQMLKQMLETNRENLSFFF